MGTPLPNFLSTGLLPAGDHWPTEEEFETRFVNVAGSTTRIPIYDGFKRHRAELLAAGAPIDSAYALDGSYTTDRRDPRDIDFVVEIDAAVFDQSMVLQALTAGSILKSTYLCDAYVIPVYAPDHPDFDKLTVKGRAYWDKFFARDRTGRSKGRVRCTVGGFR